MKPLTAQTTPTQTLPIHVTVEDKAALEKMINNILRSGKMKDEMSSLISELERAKVLESEWIPRNVVTMNSRVSIIDGDTAERMKFTLVYPEDADADSNKISILSPIGSGMLGYQVGDEVEWVVPAGVRKFTIAKVDHQPEAAKKRKEPIPSKYP